MITYIDLDGVLVDFYKGVHDWMGIKVKRFPYKTGWDWPKEIGCNYREFPVEFWVNLPICKDAGKWLEMAKGRVIIATYPCGINSITGKKIWIYNNFPNLDVIFIKDKWLLSNNNRWLIDDSKEQVENFSEYGGTGVLVPRPWNERK